MYNWPERKRQRLKGFDYSSDWYYFVTICTKDRKNYFGKIIRWKMRLNNYWKIAQENWKKIIQHYQNVKIDEFIIMPNHIHWIIILAGKDNYHSNISNNIQNRNENIHSLPNLSNVIKWFKIWCTKEIRNENLNFWWQKSFFDRIIRNENQLEKTREYIKNNPLKHRLNKNNSNNF